MSHTLPDLAPCLPSEFLTGGMDHKTLFLNNHHHIPYDFASSSSTESESEDDDIAGLTRPFTRSVSLQERLENPYSLEKRVLSGSPESTLTWNVSGHAQVRSSPTTPFRDFRPANEDSWDLIYAAAGQVARMKMNPENDGVFANRGLLGAPIPSGSSLSHHHRYVSNFTRWTENEEFIRQQQIRRRAAGICGGRCGTCGPVVNRQSAWSPLQVENHRPQQPHNGSVVKPLGRITGDCGRNIAVGKKERTGTGVFLPRNYCNVPSESKKKPACSPTHLPDGITQSFNKNMDSIITPPQPDIQIGFNPWYQFQPPPHHFKPDELADLVMARRTAVMLAQQRRISAVAGVPESRMGPPDVVLPQEWTY